MDPMISSRLNVKQPLDCLQSKSLNERIAEVNGHVDELKKINLKRGGKKKQKQIKQEVKWELKCLNQELGTLKKQSSIESSYNVLLSKGFALGGVALESGFQALQYLSSTDNEQISQPTLVTRGMSLVIAVSDCTCAAFDYASKSYGYQGLKHGGDAIAGTVSWLARKCGFSDETSDSIAKSTSTVSRVGLTMKHLVSGNVSSAVVCNLAVPEVTKNIVVHHLTTNSQITERQSHKLNGESNKKGYVLDENGIGKLRKKTSYLEYAKSVITTVGGESSLAKGANMVLSSVKGGTEFIESQYKPISSKLNYDPLKFAENPNERT